MQYGDHLVEKLESRRLFSSSSPNTDPLATYEFTKAEIVGTYAGTINAPVADGLGPWNLKLEIFDSKLKVYVGGQETGDSFIFVENLSSKHWHNLRRGRFSFAEEQGFEDSLSITGTFEIDSWNSIVSINVTAEFGIAGGGGADGTVDLMRHD